MKYLTLLLLCISVSCQAMPWPSRDLVNPMQDGRIYKIDSSKRYIKLFAKNQTGSVTIECRGKDVNNTNTLANIMVTPTLYIEDELQPESFSIVFLDHNHEILEKAEFTKKINGIRWVKSYLIKTVDLYKYTFIEFIF